MPNPYDIEGPAVLSFSGGLTAAYMLRKILDAGLRPDVHVLFANTGKERPETLDFVHEIEVRWGVEVHWLERPVFSGRPPLTDRYRVVDYATASRDGRPFDDLIEQRKRLPNPLIRMCTTELKIRVMKHWMMAQGYKYWAMIIGLRADEPRRVANQERANENNKERWSRLMPLHTAGVTLAEVTDFWAAQPFQLQLAPHEGNCDLCFLKSVHKKQLIATARPDLVEWWARHEEKAGQPFRLHHPTYLNMLTVEAPDAAFPNEIDCSCTD